MTGDRAYECTCGKAHPHAQQLLWMQMGHIPVGHPDANPPKEDLMNTEIDALQRRVGEWSEAMFRSDGSPPNPLANALAIAEETGEVCRAVLKRSHGGRPETDWHAELPGEVADVVITALVLAHNEGFSLAEAIEAKLVDLDQRLATALGVST